MPFTFIRPSSTRRSVIAAALALPTLWMVDAAARDAVKPGAPAPEFTLKDTAGMAVSLSSFRGKTVVLEWNNPECPYVRKNYGAGNMQSLQKEATGQGIVWLTINSGPPGAQGHLSELEADKFVADRKAHPTAYLLDSDGKVGRAFGATVTPHMYVIDQTGVLAYMGGIDDKPTANPADIKGARNYVLEAIAALASGHSIKTASARPYGCQIKYSAPKS